jgi:hypothetical protein
VLDVAEESACPLRMMLSKTRGIDPSLKNQYYLLRSIYCRAKFAEKYGKKPLPAELSTGVPQSIADYWTKCDGVLQQIIAKTGLQFYAINIPVKPADFDDPILVDATGRMSDNEFVVIKLVWGSQLRKHYKIQLVKQLDYLHAADAAKHLGGRPLSEIAIAALVVGKDDDDKGQADVSKLVRFMSRSDILDKKGEIKDPGWDTLRAEFTGALEKTRSIIVQSTGNPLHLVPTVPGPMTCGSCPFHNTTIAPGKMCTGYVKSITR